jgi:hypothetical protein
MTAPAPRRARRPARKRPAPPNGWTVRGRIDRQAYTLAHRDGRPIVYPSRTDATDAAAAIAPLARLMLSPKRIKVEFWAAYWSGDRAGGLDPGYALTLMGRDLAAWRTGPAAVAPRRRRPAAASPRPRPDPSTADTARQPGA